MHCNRQYYPYMEYIELRLMPGITIADLYLFSYAYRFLLDFLAMFNPTFYKMDMCTCL